jgi:serine/threonine kinase 32
MVLQSLHHHYIVNLKYAFQDDENLFMVLDLAEGGDLRCHLDRLKVMKEDTLMVYAAEISHALDYLHGNRIIHRYFSRLNYSFNNSSNDRLVFSLQGFKTRKFTARQGWTYFAY